MISYKGHFYDCYIRSISGEKCNESTLKKKKKNCFQDYLLFLGLVFFFLEKIKFFYKIIIFSGTFKLFIENKREIVRFK